MFLQELKNSNNKNRLLTDKMNGTTVFKIPDELWDRSYPMFCVELLGKNIKLECRPHGFTEDDVPVYTRTGKVANKLPYPEDIVRYERNPQKLISRIFYQFFFPDVTQFYKPGKLKLVIASTPTVPTPLKKMIDSGKKTWKNAKSFSSKMGTKV